MESSKIATNMRTLHILEILGQADNPMTPTEINEHLGLPKQTVHRICSSLVEEGFLIRDINGKRLRPSRRMRALASGIAHASHFHIARHQVLIDVAEQVSETVNFVVPEANGMTYLDRVETDWPFRIQLPVGSAVPFHCTASGKTFLASLSTTRRQAMVDSLHLKRLTPNTFTSNDELMAELKTISRQKFAVDNEEFMEDMVALAVPVHDPEGRYFAALAFHGPKSRMALRRSEVDVGILQEGARRLSAAIFA